MKTIIIIGIIILCCISVVLTEVEAYKIGQDKGFVVALDTINKIMAKQLKSDTSVTQLVLINPDTFKYILSRKTVLKH